MRIHTCMLSLCLLFATACGVVTGTPQTAFSQLATRPPAAAHWIRASSMKPSGTQRPDVAANYGLKRNDLSRLQTIPNVQEVVPVRSLRGTANYAGKSASVTMLGTTPEYMAVGVSEVVSGRFLTDADTRQRQNVCTISESAARSLFGSTSPAGRHLRFGSNVFTVVGIIRPRRISREPQEPAPLICIPISTMQSRMGDVVLVQSEGTFDSSSYELTDAWIRFPTLEDKTKASNTVRTILRRQHPNNDVIIDFDPFEISRGKETSDRSAQ